MTRLLRYLLLVLGVGATTFSRAQEDCELTLNKALEEFNAGHFYIIPSVLDPCLNQFTLEQQQRAYLLLAETYLLLDDAPAAKKSYLNVLKANPEFQTDTALHQIDLIYLSKKFTATSIFSWSAKGGGNTSIIRLIHEQSSIGDRGDKSRYDLKFGYQAGIGGDFNFNDRFTVRGELIYLLAAYQQRNNNFFNLDTKVLLARQNWLALPLTVHYLDTKGRYRPYGYAGYQIQYLLAERGNVTITNNRPSASDAQQRERTPQESPELDFIEKRNRFNQSLVFGGGVKMKVGLDFLFVDLRYTAGMKNVVSKKNAFANYDETDLTSPEHVASQNAATRFMHVDNYFRTDNLSISVGFLRPIYKPLELKRARTRSVAKQLKSQ